MPFKGFLKALGLEKVAEEQLRESNGMCEYAIYVKAPAATRKRPPRPSAAARKRPPRPFKDPFVTSSHFCYFEDLLKALLKAFSKAL